MRDTRRCSPPARRSRAAHAAVVLVHGRGASAEDILGFAGPLAATGRRLPRAAGGRPHLVSAALPRAARGQRAMAHFGARASSATCARRIAAAGIRRPSGSSGSASRRAPAWRASTWRDSPRRWGGLVAAVGGRIGPQGTAFEDAGDLARHAGLPGLRRPRSAHSLAARRGDRRGLHAPERAQSPCAAIRASRTRCTPKRSRFARRLLEQLAAS